MPKFIRVTLTCRRCGREFSVPPCAAERRAHCSRTCVRPLLPHPDDPTAMLVPLTKGMVAVIDADDAEVVARYNWFAKESKEGWSTYAVTRIDNRPLRMHQLLCSVGDGELPDHKDGDGLNNRRSNLRPATNAENVRNQRLRCTNTSGYRGVSYHAFARKYYAGITRGLYRERLGSFDTAEEAARVYDDAARRLYGEFARLNFPHEGEQGARRDDG